jgi:hypothetical protein
VSAIRHRAQVSRSSCGHSPTVVRRGRVVGVGIGFSNYAAKDACLGCHYVRRAGTSEEDTTVTQEKKARFWRLQERLGDALLTVLTILFALMLFVIAPLHAKIRRATRRERCPFARQGALRDLTHQVRCCVAAVREHPRLSAREGPMRWKKECPLKVQLLPPVNSALSTL